MEFAFLSDYPPAFLVKDLLTNKLLELGNLNIEEEIEVKEKKMYFKSQDEVIFETEYGAIKSSNRKAIKYDLLNSIANNFHTDIVGLLTSKSLINSLIRNSLLILDKAIYFNKKKPIVNSSNIELISRFRYLMDYKNYYLAPHNDSGDTLLALLLPLSPNNTPTSLFASIPLNLSEYSEANDKPFYKDQFHKEYLIKESTKEGIILNYIKKEGSPLIVNRTWYAQKTPIEFGDALILPNPSFQLWNCSDHCQEFLSNKTAHGVFPPISEENRPMLLVDYVIKESNEIMSQSEYQYSFNLNYINEWFFNI